MTTDFPISRPEALASEKRLMWSTGKGTDAWEIFIASGNGDIQKIKSLLEKDPSLIRTHFDYRTPMYFAVRNNQLDAARYLLRQGANPISSGTNDTLLEMARDRGLKEMQELLHEAVIGPDSSPEGVLIAEAVKSRELNKVKIMLDENPSLVNARDEESNQPIHWAAMTRQLDVIDELIARGAEIDSKRKDGARAIQLYNGDYSYRGWNYDWPSKPREVLEHLRKRGAYVDIGMAAYIGDYDRVKALLDEDPGFANYISEYVSYYVGSGSALKNAAAGGNIEIVRLLLDSGADPNLPEEHIAPMGHALHTAAYYNHMDIVKLLLDRGAHPNVPIESSADTLSMAMSRKNQELIDLLCSRGAYRSMELLGYYGDIITAAAVLHANPSLANDVSALENAVSEGHEAFARLLLHYQPELVHRIGVGVRSGGPQDVAKSRELIEFLFSKGMDPNFKNWLGISPLHRFAQREDLVNTEFFLEHGANINVVDSELSTTPLGWAAKFGKVKMVTFLLDHGAIIHPQDVPEWSQPTAWARRRGFEEIAGLLDKK